VKARLRHWFRHRQVVVTDASSGSAARHVIIRPLRMLLAALLLASAGFAAGLYFSPEPDTSAWTYRLSQLEQEKSELLSKSAEQDALLTLRNDEIDSLKQELESLRQSLASAKKRLTMFDSILNARKEQGINIVNASTRWLDGNRIAFQMLLVKGGNYPRRVSGHMLLAATNPAGEEVRLMTEEDPEGLPYEMENHTVLKGSVDWTQEWKPDQVTIIVLNHRNKEVARKDITIERISDVTQ